jgi:plastocyanin domain-containing protein
MMRSSRGAVAVGLLVAAGFGCGKKGPVPPAEIKDVVQVTVDEDGFRPNRIPAQVGRPLTLVFTRKVEKTCADAVVIASENIRQPLPLNQTVMVTFMPSHTGDVHFACPMNMVTGEIAVQAAPGAADDDAPKKAKPKPAAPKAALPAAPAAPAAPALPAAPAAPALPK